MAQKVRNATLGVLAAIILTLPVVFGLELFTDTETVGNNSLSAGTIDLATDVTSSLLSLADMLPGDEVVAALTVSNSGTGELRYAMTTSVSGSTLLAGALTLDIKVGVTTCSSSGFDTDGTSLFSGALSSGAIGDPTQGAQTGDRTLAATASEVLCFRVKLPLSADNSLQGLSTTATFTFSAEQTKNNP